MILILLTYLGYAKSKVRFGFLNLIESNDYDLMSIPNVDDNVVELSSKESNDNLRLYPMVRRT